jgi:hypothetical protein
MSALLFTTSITIFMMSLVSEQICQMRFERRAGERIKIAAESEKSKSTNSSATPSHHIDTSE